MALPLRPTESPQQDVAALSPAGGQGSPGLPGLPERPPTGRSPRRRIDGWRVVEMVASVLLATALLGWGLPLVAGADWSDIRGVLGALSTLQVGALTAVWLAGLGVHTIALAAAMPGLSHRRAFFLNLTGSSVSNMLPLGGAAGTALNYTTSRAWGFSTGAFLRWALVTNIWDTLGKLAVPGVALLWLAVDSTESPEALVSAAVGALVLLIVLLGLTWLVLHREFGARVVGHLLDWAVGRLRLPVPEDGGYAGRAQEFRRDLSALIAAAWGRLTLGKAGYAAFQALLLWLCLSWLGGEVSPATAFAVFAAERVLSLAVITPGATGVVEIGMAGMLVAFGVTPVVAAAGVLLYRAFIVGFEIPAGGAAMLWWLIRRGHARRFETQGQP